MTILCTCTVWSETELGGQIPKLGSHLFAASCLYSIIETSARMKTMNNTEQKQNQKQTTGANWVDAILQQHSHPTASSPSMLPSPWKMTLSWCCSKRNGSGDGILPRTTFIEWDQTSEKSNECSLKHSRKALKSTTTLSIECFHNADIQMIVSSNEGGMMTSIDAAGSEAYSNAPPSCWTATITISLSFFNSSEAYSTHDNPLSLQIILIFCRVSCFQS